MAKRVFLIVMDSFGIGAEPDADLFGDIGTNTLKSCSQIVMMHIDLSWPRLYTVLETYMD